MVIYFPPPFTNSSVFHDTHHDLSQGFLHPHVPQRLGTLGKPRAVRRGLARAGIPVFLLPVCLHRAGSLTSGQAFQPLMSRAEMGLGMEYPMGGRMWW